MLRSLGLLDYEIKNNILVKGDNASFNSTDFTCFPYRFVGHGVAASLGGIFLGAMFLRKGRRFGLVEFVHVDMSLGLLIGLLSLNFYFYLFL